ncbi:hypothetical protein PYCC9005_005455 [Savitreella phatthalungensis]
MTYEQRNLHARSLQQPDKFWGEIAESITWSRKPDKVLDISGKSWRWFPGGQMNMCYECIDTHVDAGLGPQPAIIWDSPLTNAKDVITYADLQIRVQTFAGVLRKHGVGKGDVVMIYMPMVPQALVAMYACARLGAIHSVVFGGFASKELAKRIDAATPKLFLTASAGLEEKRVTAYMPLVNQAISLSTHKPSKVILLQRPGYEAKDLPSNCLDWDLELRSSQPVTECVPTDSQDPIYTLYTSGTTGTPKGVTRFSAPYAVHLKHSIKSLMNLQRGDVMFCASDIGWVVGHTYIVYAPLLGGCTSVLFEGKVPMRAGQEVWRICERWKVNVLFCAPTALRALRSADPNHEQIAKRNLRPLRNLMLAGERSEPSIVELYDGALKKHCGETFEVVDNYWSSESGSPITGVLQNLKDKPRNKPGSAGPPTPGYDVRIVDDSGKELPPDAEGNVVLKTPLPPSMLSELWRDTANRFEASYMRRFNGRWFDTGDAGKIDQDGYVHILSRSDDIINVAAHRLSTGAFEAVISTIPGVTECCVVGMPDDLKGHVPIAFIVSSKPPSFADVNKVVREEIGNIASLAGVINLTAPLPKTRSGKTLRRTCRAYVENACKGDFDAKVDVPATIEDASVLPAVKQAVDEFVRLRSKSKL